MFTMFTFLAAPDPVLDPPDLFQYPIPDHLVLLNEEVFQFLRVLVLVKENPSRDTKGEHIGMQLDQVFRPRGIEVPEPFRVDRLDLEDSGHFPQLQEPVTVPIDFIVLVPDLDLRIQKDPHVLQVPLKPGVNRMPIVEHPEDP